MSYHRLLQRQLSACAGNGDPRLQPEFLQAVSDAYDQADADRALLERSLDLSSDELLQANSELRAVVQAFPDLFLWLDRDGNITACRARTHEDLFVAEQDLIGKAIQEIPHPEIAIKFEDALRQMNTGADIVTIEYTLTVAAGERHYEARLLPLIDTNILAIIRNITERKVTEQTLRERDQQLQRAQKIEAIGQLTGGIAHDFNNLLTAMMGFCGLLQASLKDRPDDLRRLDQIQIAAGRAAALTRQLLAYGRKQVLENRLINLNTIVSGITRLVTPVLGPDIPIRTELSPTLGMVFADPGQIEQVLMNLVLNARDAMPLGGTLAIRTSAVVGEPAAMNELVGAETDAGRILLEVTDTGCGMDSDTLARAFEPYFTTKDRAKGSGLGLSMVYGIIKQSGGDIEVASEPGKGTTFRIYLPRHDCAEVEATPAAQEPEASAHRTTVLLVDDEDLVRALTREFLMQQGYNVLEASCTTEALAITEAYAGPIHAMVTDIIMPGASGVELAASMAQIRPETRVLYMSGYPGEIIANRGVLAKGCKLLQKPFTAETLEERMRDLLRATEASETTPDRG